MLNNVSIMGRLTADPVRRVTQSGIPVTSFSIACQRDFKDANGERGVDFIDIVAWRSTADFVSKYFTKGQLAVISGRLQIRDYVGSDGVKRRAAELVADSVNFGGSKAAEPSASPAYSARTPAPAPNGASYAAQAPAPAYAGAAPGGFADMSAGGDLPF